MPAISIIMPVYNGAQYLEKSLKSVENQTFKDVELVCVDDGSTDNSLDLLNDYKKTYDFLVVISQENQGSGKARNTGIANAKGDYIAFLDADDIYIDNDALEKMYAIATGNDADMVSGNLQFVEKDYSLKENRHYERGDYAYFDTDSQISPGDYGIPYAFYKSIFKRQFLADNDIVFPDLLRGQDPVFLAMAFANTDVIYTCHTDLYGYNYSAGAGGLNNKMNNYIKKKSYVQHFKDTCEVLENGGLSEVCETYKLHLTRYLNWKKNNRDEDLFKIYGIFFENPNEYFDIGDENFVIFNTAAQAYLLYNNEDEEKFSKTKEFIVEIDPEVLPKHIREKYDILASSNNNAEYIENYHNDKIERLTKRHDYLTGKIDELTGENESLEAELEKLDSKVESVKSSSGFKVAKKFKNMIK